jgi:mxaA protein
MQPASRIAASGHPWAGEPAAAAIEGRRRPTAWLAVFLLWPLLSSAASPGRLAATVPPDRPYGMGGVLEQTLVVAVPKAYALESGFLPQPGALDDWLEVRSLDWSRETGDFETTYRIRIAYQLFKGLRTEERAVIPGLPVRFDGPEPLELRGPELPVRLAPLIPPNLPDESVGIRDEAPPELRPVAGHWRRFWLCLSAALAGSGFLAWLRLDQALRAQPFGRAHRKLARLRRGAATPEAVRTATRLIHRALDETAGETLFAGQVGAFCEARAGFAGLRDDLAGFFAASRRLFFTAPDSPPPENYSLERLAELCRRCAAAERSAP